MSDRVEEILSNVSQSDDVFHGFDTSTLQRYQELLFSVRRQIGGQRFGQLQAVLWVTEAALVAVGAVLGFVSALPTIPILVKVFIWLLYLIILAAVGLTVRLIPTELKLLNQKATRIRLVNLCERLAGQLALFDLIYENNLQSEDEKKIINQLSEYMPDYNELSDEDKNVIQNCIDHTRIYNDSRETNIALGGLDVDDKTAKRLNRAVKEIVGLCQYIFTGGDFTAKLYLRTEIQTEDETVEVLASFAKHRATDDRPRGSSWVKARGNPSIVWTAIENGQPNHVQEEGIGDYYNSVLAIPLPGRIGVLAITSDRLDAFVEKDDEISVRGLAVASRANALRALRINESVE